MRNLNKTRIIALAVFSMLLLGLGPAFASSAAFNRTNIASSPYLFHGPTTCRYIHPIIENNILLFEHESKSIGPYKVVLYNVTFPSTNETNSSKAVFNIYYNNKFVGSAIMLPGQTHVSHVDGSILVIKVDETFPGFYNFQRWAKINLTAQRSICIMQPV